MPTTAKTAVRAVVIALACFLFVGCQRTTRAAGNILFEHVVVDWHGPIAPWGKAVGDVNGDQRPDLIVAGHAGGGLVWYENPAWNKHVIAADGAFGTDHEVADIDGDGTNDIVSLMNDRLVWFRNSGWEQWALAEIDRQRLHDIEIVDLDGDGRLDIVARGQLAFSKSGDTVYLYYQRAGGEWDKRTIPVPAGEGLKVTDIDGDGAADVVINGTWLKNPGRRMNIWRQHVFTRTWTWPHVYIAVGDINADGRPDIVMSPAETEATHYRIAWFEAPRDSTAEWIEHVVESNVEAVHHFIGIADFDQDGRMDIVSSMMHQGTAPAEIKIYINQNRGRNWSKQVLSKKGSHNMRIVDIDADGDPDLFGANWNGPHHPPELWINSTCNPNVGCPCWRRHQIDNARPGKAVFVHAGDIDGDGYLDVAAGPWWYRNPGTSTGGWARKAFGAPAYDVVLLTDLDSNGTVDAVATRWRFDKPDSRFVFAENDGFGNFRIRTDLPTGVGDFLQGVAPARFTTAELTQVALSWHRPPSDKHKQKGIELLTVPKRPSVEAWRIDRISDETQDEALSAGDIDGDGQIDLLLGTLWLRNDRGNWTVHKIDPENNNPPDRNRLADINGDGRPDAVVGFRAISTKGDVVWYEQGPDPVARWKRHLIGTVIGPMSLDVVDVDRDGDLDVLIGEHNLKNPASARLVLFENMDGRGGVWRERVIHTGDEHHDGAFAIDLDSDGDADIVSIGWEHGKVLWYENLKHTCPSITSSIPRS